jgi:hypothetical protein
MSLSNFASGWRSGSRNNDRFSYPDSYPAESLSSSPGVPKHDLVDKPQDTEACAIAESTLSRVATSTPMKALSQTAPRGISGGQPPIRHDSGADLNSSRILAICSTNKAPAQLVAPNDQSTPELLPAKHADENWQAKFHPAHSDQRTNLQCTTDIHQNSPRTNDFRNPEPLNYLQSNPSRSSIRQCELSSTSLSTEEYESDDSYSVVTDYSTEPGRATDIPLSLQRLGHLVVRGILLTLHILTQSAQRTQQFDPAHSFSISRTSLALELLATTTEGISERTGGSSPYSNSQTGQLSGPIESLSSSQSSTSRMKRSSHSRRDDGQGNTDDEDDGSIKRPRISPSSSASGPTIRKKFACPFFKHCPERHQRWRSCRGPGWDTVHRVK